MGELDTEGQHVDISKIIEKGAWSNVFQASMLNCTSELCDHDHASTFTSGFVPFEAPLVGAATSGIWTLPPGESGNLAVSISTPSSVTNRVCSAIYISRQLLGH